jgi:hypothetical protein
LRAARALVQDTSMRVAAREDRMSFFDKVRSGIDRAAEGVSDFAETTKRNFEINKLKDRKTALFADMGRQVYALRAQGRGIPEVEAQCKEVDGLEQEIKRVEEEVAKINAPAATEPPKPPSATTEPPKPV